MATTPDTQAGLKEYIGELKSQGKTESTSKSLAKAVIKLKQFSPEKFDLEAGGGNEAILQRGVEDPTPENLSGMLGSYQDSVYGAAGSPQTREDIRAQLEPEGGRPELLDRAAEYEKLRADYGVAGLETSLIDLKAQKEEIIAMDRQRTAAEEQKTVPMNVIAGRVSETERQTAERIDTIDRQINTYVDQLNSAYHVVETYMNFMSMDYADAVNAYNSEFSQNLEIYKLVSAEASKQQQVARANLQTIQNAISAGNTAYASMSSDQRAFISKLEAQAGLPIGFTSTLHSKASGTAGGKIISTTTREIGGVKYVDVVTQAPDGTMSVNTQKLGGVASSQTGAQKLQQDSTQMQAAIDALITQNTSKGISFEGSTGGFITSNQVRPLLSGWVADGYDQEDWFDRFGTNVWQVDNKDELQQ